MDKGILIYGRKGFVTAITSEGSHECSMFDWSIRTPQDESFVTFDTDLEPVKVVVISSNNSGVEELIRSELKIWDFGGNIINNDIIQVLNRHVTAPGVHASVSIFTDRAVHIFSATRDTSSLFHDNYHNKRMTVVRFGDVSRLDVTRLETAESMDALSEVIVNEVDLKVMDWIEFK